jgi:hypothetical protein
LRWLGPLGLGLWLWDLARLEFHADYWFGRPDLGHRVRRFLARGRGRRRGLTLGQQVK